MDVQAATKKERRKGLVPLSGWAAELLRDAFERSGGEWAFPAPPPKESAEEALGEDVGINEPAPQSHLQPRTLTRFMARLRSWEPRESLKKTGPEAYAAGLARAGRLKLLQDRTPHDLTRTGRTKLTGEELQIDEATAERVLNHAVGSRQQNTYDRNAYVTPKRIALETWVGELRRIVRV